MAAKTKAKQRSRKSASANKGAVRKRTAPRASLTNALAEAVWTDADEALAEALLELDQMQTAADAEAREVALALLAQALARTARKRGLARIGELGARVAYDADAHELDALGAKPKTVRIVARGVARGADLLRRSRVQAARVNKVASKRAKKRPQKPSGKQ
jgi:hypothetical protein